MKYFYFGRARVAMDEAFVLPDSWKDFEREIPWEYDLSLRKGKGSCGYDESLAKTYGSARVIDDKDSWKFIASAPLKLREISDNLLAGMEHAGAASGPAEAVPGAASDPAKVFGSAAWSNRQQDYRTCLATSRDYRDCVYYCGQSIADHIQNFQNAFDALLTLHEGSVIHASCVKYKGEAILFCGPSGMGKSTQARLWETYRGTYMLSSDAPAVFLRDGRLTAHGMPWDGSDQIFTQESAPVRAIVRLEQARENEIRPMGEMELFTVLLEQAHLPLWDAGAMEKEARLLKKMAKTARGYRLYCRPEESAVDLLEKTLDF